MRSVRSLLIRDTSLKLPVCYSKHYNFGGSLLNRLLALLPVEETHPFDVAKYRRVYEALSRHNKGAYTFLHPEKVTEAQLLTALTPEYLESLNSVEVVSGIVEIPLYIFPRFFVNALFLEPMKWATGGTILAVRKALESGIAINLGGGYHHAKSDSGSGFCIFADISIALLEIWKMHPGLRVLIVDLDAHQGNGYANVHEDDPRLNILDVYNHRIFPWDDWHKQYIQYEGEVNADTTEQEYMDLVERLLVQSIAGFSPELIVYVAGTDILSGDFVGAMNISFDTVIKRDECVFTHALNADTPICMVTAGGYTRQSAPLIVQSIENISQLVKG